MTHRHYYSLLKAVLFLLMAAGPLHAEWRHLGAMKSNTPQGTQITFQNSEATVVVSVLAADLVRVRMVPGKSLPQDYSWAVIKTDWPKVAVEFAGNEKTRIIRTPELEVRVDLQPFRVAFYNRQGEAISQDSEGMAWDGGRIRCWKAMPAGEEYYGLGEKAGTLAKRGHSYVMWNTDPAGYNANTDPMYQTVPFFIALRNGQAHGIFFDNTYRSSFDMGAESDGEYSFGADGGELNYYFFQGPDPRKVITRYTELVGRTELPPLWSLGYIQSSAYYVTADEFREIGANLRRRRIPCDVLFIDTLDHMDGKRIFTWNTQAFPEPAKFLAELHRDGFRALENITPTPKVDDNYWVYKDGLAGDHFLRKQDGSVFVGYLWAGKCVWPDFTLSKTRDWWASLTKHDLELGMDGFLTDMNEPTADQIPRDQGWVPGPLDPKIVVDDHGLKSPYAKTHNAYGMLETAATRQGMVEFRPNERPFVITRATYAGGQRYAAQWTGDNMSTWEDLRAGLRTVLSLGISGLPFSGSDVGGFVGYPQSELYTRWLESAVFNPYFWTHTDDHVRRLDPWAFGPEAEAINRRTIELRYRMLPYFYNAFYQETQTGLPIMRPLFLYDSADKKAMDPTPAGDNNEFMFGEDILVAPVVTEGEFQRKVYLPRGTWHDFWCNDTYSGPKTITVEAPLDRIPMFIRAGAIIPMRQVVQHVKEAPIDPLTFEIYPEGHTSRPYYEDDGVSYDYLKGNYLLETIEVDDAGGTVTTRIVGGAGNYHPPSRSLVMKLHGFPSAPRQVELNSHALTITDKAELLEKSKEGAAYDPQTHTVWVKAVDQNFPLTAVITR